MTDPKPTGCRSDDPAACLFISLCPDGIPAASALFFDGGALCRSGTRLFDGRNTFSLQGNSVLRQLPTAAETLPAREKRKTETETSMPLKLNVGDIVELKKKHPCGGNTFEILRTGMDFRMRCLQCGSQMRIIRSKLEKSVVRVVEKTKSDDGCRL